MSARALAPTFALATLLAGCGFVDALGGVPGSGVAATETRDVGEFEEIAVAGSPDVVARIGPETSVRVTADDNLLEHVVTRVEDGVLHVGMDKGRYRPHVELRVEVTTPRLRAAKVSGSGSVSASGVSGEDFEVAIAGSGDVRASGEVDRVEARVAGSGDVHLFELAAREAEVRIAGSGDVEIHPAETLSVRIAGSGDAVYQGEPTIERSIAGSGTVRRRRAGG